MEDYLRDITASVNSLRKEDNIDPQKKYPVRDKHGDIVAKVRGDVLIRTDISSMDIAEGALFDTLP